jgi:hypothetical protein
MEPEMTGMGRAVSPIRARWWTRLALYIFGPKDVFFWYLLAVLPWIGVVKFPHTSSLLGLVLLANLFKKQLEEVKDMEHGLRTASQEIGRLMDRDRELGADLRRTRSSLEDLIRAVPIDFLTPTQRAEREEWEATRARMQAARVGDPAGPLRRAVDEAFREAQGAVNERARGTVVDEGRLTRRTG